MVPHIHPARPIQPRIQGLGAGRQGLDNEAGHSDPSVLDRLDPSIDIRHKRDGVYLQATPGVQSLLDLPSSQVAIGESAGSLFLPVGESEAPPVYDPNIPEQDRIYLTRSTESMLAELVDGVMAFDGSTHNWPDTPPQRILAGDMFYALQFSPDRQSDLALLKSAFLALESPLLEHQLALARALVARPDLQAELEAVANSVRREAMKAALAGQPVYALFPTSDEMIERAARVVNERNMRLEEQQLLQETEAYYKNAESNDWVELLGRGVAYGAVEIVHSPASDGEIIYPDLAGLLRFGPVGTFIYQHKMYVANRFPDRFPIFMPEKIIRAEYGSGIVRKLSYWKNKENRVAVAVMTGAEGFVVGDSGVVTPYPEKVPLVVRQRNLQLAQQQVLDARQRAENRESST